MSAWRAFAEFSPAVNSDGGADSKPSNGGHGFQFPNGWLVIAGRGNLLYSEDHGASWTISGEMETVETKVVLRVRPKEEDANEVYMITRKSTEFRVDGDARHLGEDERHGGTRSFAAAADSDFRSRFFHRSLRFHRRGIAVILVWHENRDSAAGAHRRPAFRRACHA